MCEAIHKPLCNILSLFKLQKEPVIPIPTVQSEITISPPSYLFFSYSHKVFLHRFSDSICPEGRAHAYSLSDTSYKPQNHSRRA